MNSMHVNPSLRFFFALFLAVTSIHAQGFVNFEGKQVTPIRLSPDGTRLFAVNTPDARLSVFDLANPNNPILIAEIPVGIEPVSVNPRSNDEAWVVNEVSDSISIVSVSQRIVVDTIYVQDEPGDVVFANGRAFVTCGRRNQVRVFDVITHLPVGGPIALVGENPRALTVNSNGTKVYVAFALSGNRTTIIPPERAPAQPRPTNITNDPPQVSLIVDATNPTWTSGPNAVIRYTMPDNDVAEIDTTSLSVTRYFPRVGTVNFAIAMRPNNGDIYVCNTDARNLTRFEPNVRGNMVSNRISRVSVTNGAVTHFDLNPGIDYSVMPNLAAKSNALAQPTAVAFGPSGSFLFVAAFGTDRIARMNANTGEILDIIEVGPPSARGSAVDARNKKGPRGLALGPPMSQRLYVLNRLANTISIVNIIDNFVMSEIPIGHHDPTTATVKEGRGFLYDAKLSGNGTAACAACHIDSEMDMIAWDLGNPNGQMEDTEVRIAPGLPGQRAQFHPMKGPMTTQTLRGLLGLDPLHWRGDRTNFLHFNGAFDGLMGGSILPLADMQAYRAYINTIVFQPNPNQNLDRSMPTSFRNGNAAVGRSTFISTNYQPGLTCNTCHSLPTGTSGIIVPAQALQESQHFKVPHLRNMYQKINFNHNPGATSIAGFGFIHDGIDDTLFRFLSRPVFGVFANNTTIKNNVEAFLHCFDTGTAPTVGYTRTITMANVSSPAVANDWTLLERQAVSNNVELIVKGTIDGQVRGLLYNRVSNNYRADTTNLAAMTRAQLEAKIAAGDTLTVMGVPPGSGQRMGIDRDLDATLDGDEPRPTLAIAKAPPNVLISWPTNAPYVLERAAEVSSTNWRVDTSRRGIVGPSFTVTNSALSNRLYFRLREL
jgi:DNA-binding beta-propeller fold protein YncE